MDIRYMNNFIFQISKENIRMDPVSSKKKPKDGNWDFPENFSFPVDVRVMVKKFKDSEGDQDADGKKSKYLNTKVMKVEVCLEK